MGVIHGCSSILCVSSFPSGFEVGVWDMIVLIPDYCISIYFKALCQHRLLLLIGRIYEPLLYIQTDEIVNNIVDGCR